MVGKLYQSAPIEGNRIIWPNMIKEQAVYCNTVIYPVLTPVWPGTEKEEKENDVPATVQEQDEEVKEEKEVEKEVRKSNYSTVIYPDDLYIYWRLCFKYANSPFIVNTLFLFQWLYLVRSQMKV